MSDVNPYLNTSLTKLLNNDSFKKIYPMIDRVEVYELDVLPLIVVKIIVNDPEITEFNMYERGLDPHYFIDKHLAKFLPYYSIPKAKKVGFVVIGTEGNTIEEWLP